MPSNNKKQSLVILVVLGVIVYFFRTQIMGIFGSATVKSTYSPTPIVSASNPLLTFINSLGSKPKSSVSASSTSGAPDTSGQWDAADTSHFGTSGPAYAPGQFDDGDAEHFSVGATIMPAPDYLTD